MATEVTTPTLARDLIRIHRVITRGLTVSAEKCSQFRQSGFRDPELLRGYCDYTHSFATVLGGHHQAEDTIAFPAFEKKLSQAPYAHLASQHKEIEALLVSIHQTVNELNETAEAGLDRLASLLDQTAVIWAPHIRMEESIFSHDVLCEVFSAVEQKDLAAQMGKFGKEHSNPPQLVIPFVLFNLDLDDRTAYLANMPANVMGDLVMNAWKDNWAPMKPFLLE